MNKLLFVFIGLSLLLLGCVGSEEAAPSPTAQATVPSIEPLPSPSPAFLLTPIELEYEVSDFFSSGPEGKATITYWFEEEATCSGRKALNGIYSVSGEQTGGESVWAKTTYYYEKGELASTEFYQKGGLVFEATKFNQAFVTPNLIQEIFAAAGVDFASSEVWDSTKPLVLKDVSFFGGSKGNISIVNKGEGSGVVPCIEFEIYTQNSPYAVIACATKPTDETPYSITVYFESGDDWPAEAGTFPTWKLTRAPAKQASGESALIECIDFVRCDYVESPTQEEIDACEADGGAYQEAYDENDCVTSIECN